MCGKGNFTTSLQAARERIESLKENKKPISLTFHRYI